MLGARVTLVRVAAIRIHAVRCSTTVAMPELTPLAGRRVDLTVRDDAEPTWPEGWSESAEGASDDPTFEHAAHTELESRSVSASSPERELLYHMASTQPWPFAASHPSPAAATVAELRPEMCAGSKKARKNTARTDLPGARRDAQQVRSARRALGV